VALLLFMFVDGGIVAVYVWTVVLLLFMSVDSDIVAVYVCGQ
jgi:hypothetical protein